MDKTVTRRLIDEFKENPSKAIEQLEWCGYECEGGDLKNNVAWIAIKELLNKEVE